MLNSIRKHFQGNLSAILDVGAADGLMLGKIKDAYPSAQCTGIELSKELISASTDERITLIQGDANSLPATVGPVDIVVATAVIEHIPEPITILRESHRVLRKHGLIILTSPVPFWEKLATKVGHLKDEQHCNVMNMRELIPLLQEAGYEVVESRKFMLSPVGLPFEILIESTIRKIGLNCLFANQLLVGKKP